ncbi:hypothetical protein ACFX15_034661 [Malus domestica]
MTPLGSPPSIRSTAPSPSSPSNATADPSASATRHSSSFLRCRNLTHLKIRACRELTDAGMMSLAKNCKRLKKSQAEVEEEEKEQCSHVSVLDPQFQDDDEGRDDECEEDESETSDSSSEETSNTGSVQAQQRRRCNFTRLQINTNQCD